MALLSKFGQLSQPSSTGNQSVTGVGFTPKVVIFFGNNLATDGGQNNATYHFGVGVSSSDRRGMAGSARTGVTTGENAGAQVTTSCITAIKYDGTVFAQADFVSLDADGFTINWTTADVTARVVNYLALGGNELTNIITGSGLSSATTGNVAYTGLGFQPDAMIYFIMGSSTTDPYPAATAVISGSMGFATSSSAEGYTAWRSTNGTPTRTLKRQMAKAIATISNTGVTFEGDVVSFDSDGFTINWTTSGAQRYFYYVAFKGGRWKVGSFNQATGTGNQTTTGVGFTPRAIMLLSANAVASTTTDSHARRSFGIGTSSSSRACIFHGTTDSASPSVASNDLDSTKIIKLMTENGATPSTQAAADIVGFVPDGFTINWTTADATAREIYYLAIGETSNNRKVTTINQSVKRAATY